MQTLGFGPFPWTQIHSFSLHSIHPGYCFMKMPFGLNQAQYFFQYYMDLHFDGINETTNIIADDVVIHGESVKIVKMPPPQNKTDLASFLGMCNYLSPYIPRLSDVTSTLHELNKKNMDFVWNATYDRAFRQAKLHVANAVTLKYFNPQAPLVIEYDTSGVGIGVVLLQEGQPITFISQALTDTQKRYSNIERELLALVIVIEHLHHYVFGCHFMVQRDYAPLVNLFQKCLNDTSPRLQRLLLRLSQYEMNVQYVTQKCVPIGDCLS